ncbi:hypothetical protein LTR37_015657 [Vermiconidia calcicola]|uniref:Uncharacterized protein n=1 Tax=Vermiconidia calcicola TaxID=1690605 RepID=A0ACC3MPX2_9PEZI|nr:hypothetical protein LTR37_015657 [Vermiconidia calcicola]
MDQDAGDIIVPLIGALQAAIAVLVTIFAGVLSAQFKLLSESASKEISRIGVNLFLPALLITNVGSQLHADTAVRYVPILVWAFTYGILSILMGLAITRFFRMPAWVTPAIAFNNTTSLPLLLIQSLAATKLLDSLDSSGDAVARAQSYFLVNATCGNFLTFSLGPKLLNVWEEERRHDTDKAEDEESQDEQIDSLERESTTENEETSLLPNPAVRAQTRATFATYKRGKHAWNRLPSWTQEALIFLYSFVNPPVIGAILGATIGLVPALHRLFFNTQEEGGYLNAWLTSALRNIGDLFPALMVVIVGTKLSTSLLRMKKGESNGRVPWFPLLLITAVRFLIWPAISIAVIYLFATKTNLLDDDPILWFAMMLMPAGPPALLLTALADLAGAEEEEKMSIAKFLTIEYALSPLIFLSVVGSLKATEAIVSK